MESTLGAPNDLHFTVRIIGRLGIESTEARSSCALSLSVRRSARRSVISNDALLNKQLRIAGERSFVSTNERLLSAGERRETFSSMNAAYSQECVTSVLRQTRCGCSFLKTES